ncbi:MAG: hypothetical protein SNJ56_00345, partial [Termitinemataceae bacterium]
YFIDKVKTIQSIPTSDSLTERSFLPTIYTHGSLVQSIFPTTAHDAPDHSSLRRHPSAVYSWWDSARESRYLGCAVLFSLSAVQRCILQEKNKRDTRVLQPWDDYDSQGFES